jgi:FtsZ-binding cell division protein ZapB
MSTSVTNDAVTMSSYPPTNPEQSSALLQAEVARTAAAVQSFVQETRTQKDVLSTQNKQLTTELAGIAAQSATAKQAHRADMAELESLVNGVRAAIAENQTALQQEVESLKPKPQPIPEWADLLEMVRRAKRGPK